MANTAPTPKGRKMLAAILEAADGMTGTPVPVSVAYDAIGKHAPRVAPELTCSGWMGVEGRHDEAVIWITEAGREAIGAEAKTTASTRPGPSVELSRASCGGPLL